MIESLKTYDDLIYAYIEFDIVNEFGVCDNYGEYIHVRDLWINRSTNLEDVLSELILKIKNHPASKYAEFVYWLRDNTRLSKTFYLETALRRADKNVK